MAWASDEALKRQADEEATRVAAEADALLVSIRPERDASEECEEHEQHWADDAALVVTAIDFVEEVLRHAANLEVDAMLTSIVREHAAAQAAEEVAEMLLVDAAIDAVDEAARHRAAAEVDALLASVTRERAAAQVAEEAGERLLIDAAIDVTEEATWRRAEVEVDTLLASAVQGCAATRAMGEVLKEVQVEEEASRRAEAEVDSTIEFAVLGCARLQATREASRYRQARWMASAEVEALLAAAVPAHARLQAASDVSRHRPLTKAELAEHWDWRDDDDSEVERHRARLQAKRGALCAHDILEKAEPAALSAAHSVANVPNEGPEGLGSVLVTTVEAASPAPSAVVERVRCPGDAPPASAGPGPAESPPQRKTPKSSRRGPQRSRRRGSSGASRCEVYSSAELAVSGGVDSIPLCAASRGSGPRGVGEDLGGEAESRRCEALVYRLDADDELSPARGASLSRSYDALGAAQIYSMHDRNDAAVPLRPRRLLGDASSQVADAGKVRSMNRHSSTSALMMDLHIAPSNDDLSATHPSPLDALRVSKSCGILPALTNTASYSTKLGTAPLYSRKAASIGLGTRGARMMETLSRHHGLCIKGF
mmetsp:Transcript_61177/g.171135  ORF Transcript_61177/g.171135 Transcript_61177/m.171135 type:complete len:599 (-) Transcript_61177:79-1875(-)